MTTTDHPQITVVREEMADLVPAEPTYHTEEEIRTVFAEALQVMADRAAEGQPEYLVADNPFTAWTLPATGVFAGAWVATSVTFMLHSPLSMWAFASAIAVTCVFAWVIAGWELYEINPKKFKPAP